MTREEIEKKRQTAFRAAAFAASLCMYAGRDQAYYDTFWKRLKQQPDIYEEFTYYMEKQDFLCRAKVAGMSVADILIWEIDHFKEHLDQDGAIKCNKDQLLLQAFETMLTMAEDPASVLEKMQYATGSDYPGKF